MFQLMHSYPFYCPIVHRYCYSVCSAAAVAVPVGSSGGWLPLIIAAPRVGLLDWSHLIVNRGDVMGAVECRML